MHIYVTWCHICTQCSVEVSVYSCYCLCVSVSHTHVNNWIPQRANIYMINCRYAWRIWSWLFWSWLDLIDPLISILLNEILTKELSFWPRLEICWSIESIIWPGTEHPINMKLLRYFSDHVTHSPFDLKMTNMVAHSYCLSYFTWYLWAILNIYNGISFQGVNVIENYTAHHCMGQ